VEQSLFNQNNEIMEPIKVQTKVSTLWLFILLNIIFRDIHQYALKSHLEMLLTGFYNGTEVTDSLMLIGGFLVEIPIAMVLFSQLLKRKINRPLNIIAAVMTAAVILFTPPSDPDDVFFLVIELAAIGTILWTVWKWPQPTTNQA
jgi:mannose/fructose/N-acetylgalactosamine-specific phosphotransferase system component IIC